MEFSKQLENLGYPPLTIENLEKQLFLLSCCEVSFSSFEDVTKKANGGDPRAKLLLGNHMSHRETFRDWTEKRFSTPQELQIDIFQRLQNMWKDQLGWLKTQKNISEEQENIYILISRALVRQNVSQTLSHWPPKKDSEFFSYSAYDRDRDEDIF
jgi:hypothetical protein